MTPPGTKWLAECTARPTDVLRTWEDEELAAVVSNAWTIVEAPLLRSVDVMQILGRGGRLGPVMGYPEASLAWWLVSDGAEEHLADLPQLLVRPRGWALCCPPPHQYMHGRGWLERPDGNGKLTSPVDLGAAFSWVSPIRMERSG